MKRYLFFLLTALSSLSIQAQRPDSLSLEQYLASVGLSYDRTEQGLCYIIREPGNSIRPKKGDFVLVRYEGMRLNGDIFDAAGNQAFVYQVGYRQVIRALDQGVQLLGEGGFATLFVPSPLGYGTLGIEGVLPPNASLIYELHLDRILSQAEYDQYMLELEEQERRAYEAEIQAQFEQDLQTIRRYARNKKLKLHSTNSGLHYVLLKKGKGQNARPDSKVKLQYDGYLPDGTIFDSTQKRGAPFVFTIGKDKLIAGWEEGLQYFNAGSEGWLLMPSKLAYGPEPVEAENLFIPGNSVLIFKVKILEVN